MLLLCCCCFLLGLWVRLSAFLLLLGFFLFSVDLLGGLSLQSTIDFFFLSVAWRLPVNVFFLVTTLIGGGVEQHMIHFALVAVWPLLGIELTLCCLIVRWTSPISIRTRGLKIVKWSFILGNFKVVGATAWAHHWRAWAHLRLLHCEPMLLMGKVLLMGTLLLCVIAMCTRRDLFFQEAPIHPANVSECCWPSDLVRCFIPWLWWTHQWLKANMALEPLAVNPSTFLAASCSVQSNLSAALLLAVCCSWWISPLGRLSNCSCPELLHRIPRRPMRHSKLMMRLALWQGPLATR